MKSAVHDCVSLAFGNKQNSDVRDYNNFIWEHRLIVSTIMICQVLVLNTIVEYFQSDSC